MRCYQLNRKCYWASYICFRISTLLSLGFVPVIVFYCLTCHYCSFQFLVVQQNLCGIIHFDQIIVSLNRKSFINDLFQSVYNLVIGLSFLWFVSIWIFFSDVLSFLYRIIFIFTPERHVDMSFFLENLLDYLLALKNFLIEDLVFLKA